MTRLIVCCDGTWNTPDQHEMGLPAPTNVVKFADALARTPDQQIYYHPGVGTEGNRLDRLTGGGLGKGLDANVKSAYQWIARTYRPDDEIWLLGFSRGVYTARSVGGMISRCGLLDLRSGYGRSEGLDGRSTRVRRLPRQGHDDGLGRGCPFHNAAKGASTFHSTPIFFIGVWDTVGSAGRSRTTWRC